MGVATCVPGVPPDVRDAYPPLRGGCFVFNEVRSSVSPSRLSKGSVDGDVGCVRSTDVIACVSFGSFNVCTLGASGSRSKFVAGRPALIRRQVRELGANLLGVQEARSAAGARVVDGFVVLASGANKGTLGCGLWADVEKPYASVDGKDYCFRMSDLVVIFASPRVLVVRVTARCLQCTVVVAHAPHSGVDAAVHELWWDDLSLRLAGQADVVLPVDANARLGPSVSKSVGSGGFCQQEDHIGFLCHRALVELSLSLPGVFLPRLVLLTRRRLLGLRTVARRIALITLPCLSPGTVATGHVAVTLLLPGRFVMSPLPRCMSSILRRTGRTTSLWRYMCDRFKVALRSIRPPLWSVSVSVEHERYAASAVRRAARSAFGTPAKRPRMEHIDDAAWSLICDRRTVKTWCRERRVSAASRGIAPWRTPDPLSVFMWASSRGDSAPLASRVFCELAASVAPLVEGHVVQCGLWESLRVFLRHSGGVLKGDIMLLVSSSLMPLRASLMLHRLVEPMTLLGASYARSPAGVGLSGRDPELCRVGLVRMVFLPPLPRRFLVLPLDILMPLKLRECVLSNLLPTDTAALALHLPLVL